MVDFNICALDVHNAGFDQGKGALESIQESHICPLFSAMEGKYACVGILCQDWKTVDKDDEEGYFVMRIFNEGIY
jgi:hypothetical protein